ncbi:MAG: uracil-DNA glycosylase, partial [Rhodospirillaceae bacterium]|nr:uracil-DNA glycosylase [Rhodospirillaceae bacterium]
AGQLLYPTLLKFGLATGPYDEHPDDGLRLVNARITNAVRCVPPQNKPIGAEQKSCRTYLVDEFENLPKLKTILALGRIGHDAVVTTLDLKKADYPFSHAARHTLPDGRILTDSYHCSRYNLNTRRLTPDMFETVFKAIT